MPTYQFEAMDATGQEIRDVIDAATEEEAQTTIRQMGYFVTKITEKKAKAAPGAGGAVKADGKKRAFAIGGASSKQLTTFTRQLSILQDSGLPILRSLRILEEQSKPGALKNSLMDVCDEIEAGSTLSEAMTKCPKVFNRLYVNMIKAGEAGGALEIILRRLSDFMERAETLKRTVKGAMIYPIAVILIAACILIFIMIKIVPVFSQMFEDFGLKLPAMTQLLIAMSNFLVEKAVILPLLPVALVLFLKLMRKFKQGRVGWDVFILKLPIFGKLMEKNILARTTRTLGTLIASGVPILEGLNITRETAGNAVFENMFGKVSEAIREGETISKPMREHAAPGFVPMGLFFWVFFGILPGLIVLGLPDMVMVAAYIMLVCGVIGAGYYVLTMNSAVVDLLVINMIDVGEETGELDTMLYKVADTYDEEVKIMTESLTRLMEPIIIVFLGGTIGFIVISLFIPLVSLIQGLS